MAFGKRVTNRLKKGSGTPRGPHYLIEFRYSGENKQYLKRIIRIVSAKFRIQRGAKSEIVPHITLYGPFKTNNESEMVRKVKNICSKYDLVDFKIDGFGKFRKDVIFVKINPSKQLEKLKSELVRELASSSVTSNFDFQEYNYISTLAFKGISGKFDKVLECLKEQTPPQKNQLLLRLTIIRGKTIFYEYDFMQKRLLNRTQSLNMELHKKTMRIHREKLSVGRKENPVK